MCGKCGSRYMVDDSHGDIKVYKCWVCGNRLYVGYPKRLGSLVCFRCGDGMDTRNDLGYCAGCMKVLEIPCVPIKARRKSPRHVFH